ncbi:hypothetical protein D3C86_1457580 [compost metagenome]
MEVGGGWVSQVFELTAGVSTSPDFELGHRDGEVVDTGIGIRPGLSATVDPVSADARFVVHGHVTIDVFQLAHQTHSFDRVVAMGFVITSPPGTQGKCAVAVFVEDFVGPLRVFGNQLGQFLEQLRFDTLIGGELIAVGCGDVLRNFLVQLRQEIAERVGGVHDADVAGGRGLGIIVELLHGLIPVQGCSCW